MQIDRFRPGLLPPMLGRDSSGAIIRKSGVMSMVLCDGDVAAGDSILAELPAPPHLALEVVQQAAEKA